MPLPQLSGRIRYHHNNNTTESTVLPPLVSLRFQVLFHSPPGVLFTFPSRYLFAIGRWRVFSLGRWSSRFPTGFLVSRGTRGVEAGRSLLFAYRTITFYGRPFQIRSTKVRLFYFPAVMWYRPFNPHNPDDATPTSLYTSSVWAVPCSLAATGGIAFAFFSSGY